MRQGKPSPKYGHLGVYFHSTGPTGPVPGERLQAVIYDHEDRIVRRFEQIRGRCIDDGHVDFFGSHACRPALYEMPVIDIAPDGTQTILIAHVPASASQLITPAFTAWVAKFGVEQRCVTHSRDEECTVGHDGCCTVCGVSHTETCVACGGKGFHRDSCSPEKRSRAKDEPTNA